MASDIPNLWPKFDYDSVLSPALIARAQATNLRDATGGRLEGELKTQSFKGLNDTLTIFNIVAPSVERYSFELFRLIHDKKLPYPVRLLTPFSSELADSVRAMGNRKLIGLIEGSPEVGPEGPTFTFRSSSQDEFISILRELFMTRGTTQVINSLLAMTNEGTSSPSLASEPATISD